MSEPTLLQHIVGTIYCSYDKKKINSDGQQFQIYRQHEQRWKSKFWPGTGTKNVRRV